MRIIDLQNQVSTLPTVQISSYNNGQHNYDIHHKGSGIYTVTAKLAWANETIPYQFITDSSDEAMDEIKGFLDGASSYIDPIMGSHFMWHKHKVATGHLSHNTKDSSLAYYK